MKFFKNSSLKSYNSFGIDVMAERFVSVSNMDELKSVLKGNYAEELFVLGGGSNMLLTKDITATVLHIDLKGIKVIKETEDSAYIQANAGENWHEFVLWTLAHDYGGLENLSLIPGNIGSSPIQNIGAYGVELKDHFVSCEAIDIQTIETINFNAEECDFGYRNSIFKNRVKGKYIITSVTFKLSKKNHKLYTKYGSINEALEESGITKPSIRDVSNAVIRIRQEKLPDPSELGNSGSFFKNPVISAGAFQELQKENPEMPHYKISDNEFKVPAGWLIDRAGYKGFREGDAGVHKNQALVLVNYGTATGSEILILAKKIQDKVQNQFRIALEPEVNIF
jgi:UDP-N-acetylmuramate dehydrogenase